MPELTNEDDPIVVRDRDRDDAVHLPRRVGQPEDIALDVLAVIRRGIAYVIVEEPDGVILPDQLLAEDLDLASLGASGDGPRKVVALDELARGERFGVAALLAHAQRHRTSRAASSCAAKRSGGGVKWLRREADV